MNKLKATITEIFTNSGISKIKGSFSSAYSITAITLEMPKNIKNEDSVFFVFKETEVGIAKNFSGEISFSNCFEGRLLSLQSGALLSRLSIDIGSNTIYSIITTEAAKRLALQEGDTVMAFIKATEVSLEVESE